MTIYVKNTGADTNTGAGFAVGLSKATLAGADAIDVAGDTIMLSPTHTESTAATVTYSFAGTVANPTKVLSVDSDATDAPTGTVLGAQINTTGAFHLRVGGNAYFEGIRFNCGNASNAGILSLNNTGTANQAYKNCDIFESDTHPSAAISIGPTTSGSANLTELVDCRFKISNATQYIGIANTVRISGGSTAVGTTSPTNGLFNAYTTTVPAFLLVENFDMSNLAVGVHLVGVPAASGAQRTGIFKFVTCKLPAGWTGNLISTPGTLTSPFFRAEMYNCDAGDTNYRLWIACAFGSIKSEIALVKTGGATDGVTPLAWKMESTATANEYGGALKTGDFGKRSLAVGAAVTVTVDILHDSTTALTNAEVWLEVDYLGTVGFPLGVRATTKRATPLTTPAAVPASLATWTTTGMVNPNRQKLAVTFTPQKHGYYVARVCYAKPSGVLYVDPTVQVS